MTYYSDQNTIKQFLGRCLDRLDWVPPGVLTVLFVTVPWLIAVGVALLTGSQWLALLTGCVGLAAVALLVRWVCS